jgi:ABC-2 type transport system permease protein
MTATDITGGASTNGARHHRTTLFPRALGFLPRNRMGAVAAKEMRYFFRDPRRRGPVIAALIVPALFLFTTLRDAQVRPAYATLLALVALLPASGLTLNQFGLDGAALWSMIVAGVDARADLVGKNIATALLVCPLVTLPAVAAAAATDGWTYIPLTLGLAPGMLGVILAIGNLVSVRAPYAVPDRKNPLASNPGQGCIGALGAIGSLFVDMVLLVPAIVVISIALTQLPLAPASVVAIVFTTAYGALIWWSCTRLAARFVEPRLPEVLDAVSPRHAA